MESEMIAAVEKSFKILELLAKNGAMGVTEIGKSIHMNKATVFRQLATLFHLGYVKKIANGEKYQLTLKLLSVAGDLLEVADIRNELRPFLEEIAQETGETVHLVQRDGLSCVYVDKVEPSGNAIRMVSRIGAHQPLYCTAVGKAMLSRLNDDEIKDVFQDSDISQITPKTLTKWDDFLSDINKIRKLGYAIDDEENEIGVRCVAVSLDKMMGEGDYAVSVSAPITRLPWEKVETVFKCLSRLKRV